MHTVEIGLVNPAGWTLCIMVGVPVRNTPYENEARTIAEARANSIDSEHAKHGHWSAHSSRFAN
jgi:hypothetical protein